MSAARAKEIPLSQLSRRERFAVYWGCYWRAVVFVLGQIGVIVPLFIAFNFAAARWISRDDDASLLVFVATESCSVVVGFCFVAFFVRWIIGRRLGRVRFALVVDDAEATAAELDARSCAA